MVLKPNQSSPSKTTKKSVFNLIPMSGQLKALAKLTNATVKGNEMKIGKPLSRSVPLESTFKKGNQQFSQLMKTFNQPEFMSAKYIDFYGFLLYTDNQLDINQFDKKFGSSVRKAGYGLLTKHLSVVSRQDANSNQSFNLFINKALDNHLLFFVRDKVTGKAYPIVPELFQATKSTPAQRQQLTESLAEYQLVQQLSNSYQICIESEKHQLTSSVEELKGRKQISISSIVHQELPK